VAIGFALAPLYFTKRQSGHNLTRSTAPLSGNQIMRGAYSNYGSKDVGPDPDWVDGKYVGKSWHTFNPTPEQLEEHRADMARRAAAADAAVAAEAAAAAGGAGKKLT